MLTVIIINFLSNILNFKKFAILILSHEINYSMNFIPMKYTPFWSFTFS